LKEKKDTCYQKKIFKSLKIMTNKVIIITGYGGCCQTYVTQKINERYKCNNKKKFKGSKHILNINNHKVALPENKIFLFVFRHPFYMLLSHFRRNTIKPYDWPNCWIISHFNLLNVDISKYLKKDKIYDEKDCLELIRKNNYEDIFKVKEIFYNAISYYKKNKNGIKFLDTSCKESIDNFKKSFSVKDFEIIDSSNKYDKYEIEYQDVFDDLNNFYIKVKKEIND